MIIYLTIFLISVNIILSSLVIRYIYPAHLSKDSLFLFDLIGYPLYLPQPAIFLFGLVNIVLLIIIGKSIFKNKSYFIPAFIYSISPWSFYLTALGSIYIYFLSLILLGVYCLLIIKFKHKFGTYLLTGICTLLVYSSLLTFFFLPMLLAGLIWLKIISFQMIKKSIILTIIFCLPILIFSFKHLNAFGNIYTNKITIFSDPGLINSVNVFQGQSQNANLGILGKVSENKYIYFTKFVVFKFLKNIAPSTFFTPQEKLLQFSFSPPVHVGFIIPCFYGLYHLIKSANTFKYLILSLVLIIPAILSERIVDLNRLIIFSPIIFSITTFGIIKLLQKKKIIFKRLLFISLIIVIFQFLITISDISLREYSRFERNFNNNFEISYR